MELARPLSCLKACCHELHKKSFLQLNLVGCRMTKVTQINVFSIFIVLMLLIGYSGVAYPAYPMIIVVLILFLNRLQLDKFDILMLLLILIFSSLKLLEDSIPTSLLTLKYFFGFFIFYLLFRQTNINSLKINFNFVLISISIILILEAVLIHTILPASLWPNYPKNIDGAVEHAGLFFGFYQRPYGIGTSPTVTTTLMICLLFIRDKVHVIDSMVSRFATFISVVAVLISLSGTGFFLLIMYFALDKLKLARITIVLLLFVSIFSVFYFDLLNRELYEAIYKISPAYTEFLFLLKSELIADSYSSNSTLWELLFGKKWFIGDPVPLGGDFGLLNFIVYGGIITVLLYIPIIIKRLNRFNYLVILLLFVGAVHYAAIFSTPGQIIFSFCLALDAKKMKMYKKHLEF